MTIDIKNFGKFAVLMGGQARTGRAGAPCRGDVTPKREAGRSCEGVFFEN